MKVKNASLFILIGILILITLKLIYELQSEKSFMKPIPLKYHVWQDYDDDEEYKSLSLELPKIPFYSFRHYKTQKLYKYSNCGEFPSPWKLNIFNNYWQTFQNRYTLYELYNAFYDNRESLGDKAPLVRVLAMVYPVNKKFPTSYCQLWFNNRINPIVVKVTEHILIWSTRFSKNPKYFYPYLLTCPLSSTKETEIPHTVSLVTERCATAQNALKIINENLSVKETKKQFAVCVKAMMWPFKDMSAILIEWLEMLRVLGVEKVYAYKYILHPNISKVLAHYEAEGFLDLQSYSLPTGAPLYPYYLNEAVKDWYVNVLNELVPYNDCFYRNMHKYDYIVLLDIDEMIVPAGNLTKWSELIDIAHNKNIIEGNKCPYGYADVCFNNFHYPQFIKSDTLKPSHIKEIPSYQHMLQHIVRFAQHDGERQGVKCFHNTTTVITLHNHYSLEWVKSCYPISLESEQGRLQHYRIHEYDELKVPLVIDTNIWRWKETLINRTREILKVLGWLDIVD